MPFLGVTVTRIAPIRAMSHARAMHCVTCGQNVDLGSGGERVGFRDECVGCKNDLHTCTHCKHYDPGAYNQCREPNSERVADTEVANRCDWFSPGEGGGPQADGDRQSALGDLEALFKKK